MLYGLSRLPVSAIVAVVAGGALLYRGLTGHCGAKQALDMSSARGLEHDETDGLRTRPRREVTDGSLAATGESPQISAG
jgi:hypothetical protein